MIEQQQPSITPHERHLCQSRVHNLGSERCQTSQPPMLIYAVKSHRKFVKKLPFEIQPRQLCSPLQAKELQPRVSPKTRRQKHDTLIVRFGKLWYGGHPTHVLPMPSSRKRILRGKPKAVPLNDVRNRSKQTTRDARAPPQQSKHGHQKADLRVGEGVLGFPRHP